MIPAAFDYVRPATLDEAVAALAEHGDEAKLLAGGHSLLPLMRLRLAAPGVLIDLGRITELRGVRDDGDRLAIGAMTTHHEVMTDPLVREHCTLLAEVTATVGDRQVRHRGTLGGALAHGDAAGDHPCVALALDAELVVAGPDGRRSIAASDFFVDYLETALAPDEILVEARFPKLSSTAGWGWDYQKFNRVAQAWAIVGVCAVVQRSNGSIGDARIGLTHMGTTPLRAGATETALRGAGADPATVRTAAEHASDGTNPPADLNATAAYRRHLAQVLTRRAVDRALAR